MLEHVLVAPWDEEVAACPARWPRSQSTRSIRYLLTYTSGTTGKPKGVLHVHGGLLVSITREAAYLADIHPGDVTPLRNRHGLDHRAWPVIGGGALGATIVFAEGAPELGRARPTTTTNRGGSALTMLGYSPNS